MVARARTLYGIPMGAPGLPFPQPTPTPTPGVPNTNPSVNITHNNGQKIGTYSTGDTINYKVDMINVDSVASYYNTIPSDTCSGGPTGGEQKPWVINSVAITNSFDAEVKPCQAGATYIITVIGTNRTSGKIDASSISVYIRPNARVAR